MKKTTAGVIFFAALTLSGMGAEQKNLIWNPAFEQQEDGSFPGWGFHPMLSVQAEIEKCEGKPVLSITSPPLKPGESKFSNLCRISAWIGRNPGPGNYIFSIKVRVDKKVESMKLFRFHNSPEKKAVYALQTYQGINLPPPGQWRTLVLETDFPQDSQNFQLFVEALCPGGVTMSVADPRLTKKEIEMTKE